MLDAWEFSEYKTVHDCALEIMSHTSLTHQNAKTENAAKAESMLAASRAFYVEPDEVMINMSIDTEIKFVVENGNPGFRIRDAIGQRYRCFVKDVDNLQIGDHLKMKITNIPGFELNTNNRKEIILYLEPRVSQGDIIEIEISSLSHTGNSFTFRHRSYDGFLWLKKREVNKNVFNKHTLGEKDKVLAKILYTTEEIKTSKKGTPTRLGLIKAIPLKIVSRHSFTGRNQDTVAARALN
jgi:hypothetical protein